MLVDMTNGELHELFAGIEDVALFRDLEFGGVFGASRRMLAHLDQWVESYHAEIAAADPGRDVYAHYEHEGRLHESVYNDAAYSTAVIAILAPMVEGLFVHGAEYLRSHDPPARVHAHVREQLGTDFWDPHFYFENGKQKGIAAGIIQLVDAVDGSTRCFPPDLAHLLPPLFSYRNAALHCGFEWLPKDRDKFHAKVGRHGWEDLFDWARVGDEPWIAYMSADFIRRATQLVDDSAKAFARVIRAWAANSSLTGEG